MLCHLMASSVVKKVSVAHYSVKHNVLNLVRGNSPFHDKRHRFTGAVPVTSTTPGRAG